MISDLVVEGEGVQWYDVDGSLLDASAELIDGQVVYASQTIDGCEGTDTLEVTVSISDPSSPTGDSVQSFCNTAMISDLVVEGEGVQWYDADGSLLDASTELIDGQVVYASQTIDGCEGTDRLEVTVSISVIPEPTIEFSSQEFCLESNPSISSIIIPETNYSIIWYDSEFGDTELDSDYLLEDGNSYYFSFFDSESGCESIRVQVDVTVIPCDVNIYNAISINNNSQNDYMVIEYVEYYPNNKLQIFNRNGQLVYLQNNYGADQNKRFYGKGNVGGFLDRSAYLPSGSYMYIFTYFNPFTNNTLTKKGFVTIHNIVGR